MEQAGLLVKLLGMVANCGRGLLPQWAWRIMANYYLYLPYLQEKQTNTVKGEKFIPFRLGMLTVSGLEQLSWCGMHV